MLPPKGKPKGSTKYTTKLGGRQSPVGVQDRYGPRRSPPTRSGGEHSCVPAVCLTSGLAPLGRAPRLGCRPEGARPAPIGNARWARCACSRRRGRLTGVAPPTSPLEPGFNPSPVWAQIRGGVPSKQESVAGALEGKLLPRARIGRMPAPAVIGTPPPVLAGLAAVGQGTWSAS